ncbi:MAG: hypothetical protein KQH79_11480 [Bacteroidetes bacterium]|nr:hypothetical protein [Bacteroidota bacterium]
MKRQILILVLLILFLDNCISQDKKVSLQQTAETWIESKTVNDKFLIKCYIPENLSKPIDSLPIVFVLDADKCFAMTYDIVKWLIWSREIPKVAIIGIAYGSTDSDWWVKRSRDFSVSKDKTEVWGKFPLAGGGENFKDFLENELIPYIGDEYNLKSENRTIVGLSLGGLISTDILFSRPHLFQRYIIAGPALQWNDREIFTMEKEFSKHNNSLNAIVFNSIGSKDDKERIIKPWNDFNMQIEKRNYNGLIFKTSIIENETHISMFPSALTQGLIFTLNQ